MESFYPKLDIEAKKLVDTAQEGRCAHCNHRLAVTRRHLHKDMVKFLRRLVDLHRARPGETAFSSKEVIAGGEKKSTDATYLRFWGLLESPRRGYFLPTELGHRFVEGFVRVPEWIEFLAGPRPVAFSKTLITLAEVKGVLGSVSGMKT